MQTSSKAILPKIYLWIEEIFGVQVLLAQPGLLRWRVPMNIIKISTFVLDVSLFSIQGTRNRFRIMILHVLLLCNSENRMHKITQRGAETAASIIRHL